VERGHILRVFSEIRGIISDLLMTLYGHLTPERLDGAVANTSESLELLRSAMEPTGPGAYAAASRRERGVLVVAFLVCSGTKVDHGRISLSPVSREWPQNSSGDHMTLKHVRPAMLNSTKLLALVLFAIGIAIFAYFLADQGTLRRPPIASTIAWTGGFVSLAMDRRKSRAEPVSRQLALAAERQPASPNPPARSHRLSSRRENDRKSPRSADSRHTSSAAEYTHQTSHF
jgi:hypothetical protein